VDEINQFMLINAAEDRRDIEDNVYEIIQKIVRDNPGIVFEEITQLLENQHPEYAIENNPYAYSALVDTRISKLLYSFDLICDKGGYFASSDVEREKMLKTEAEKRVKDFGKRYDEGIVNELTSVMSANPYEIKVHDIIKLSSNPKLKDASLAGRSIGRNMAYLITHGMVEERAKGYIINSKYMNYHVSFDDIFSLHEENYGSFIISTLSEHKEEKMSLNLISELADKKLGELKEKALDREERLKLINLRKGDVNLYVELCYYREQGILENESDEISSLWKYVG
jgi:predicted HTH domain antitoxin